MAPSSSEPQSTDVTATSTPLVNAPGADARSDAPSDARSDPVMRTLFHMSRTAGVGLQDYAEVNVAAVVGILLALASVLVLIFADGTALLALPALAIAVSLFAFLQIQRSNGTQTGRLISVAGVLIAGLIAGANVASRVSVATKEARDTAAIRSEIKKFQGFALSGKAADAYAMFDSRFQSYVQRETFERTLAVRLQRVFGGTRVIEFDVGDRVAYEADANGGKHATALLIITGDGKTPQGEPFRAEEPTEFTNLDGTWKFHAMPGWFVAVKPVEAAPGGGPNASAPATPTSTTPPQ